MIQCLVGRASGLPERTYLAVNSAASLL